MFDTKRKFLPIAGGPIALVGASDANSAKFEEFWAFTRPVGPNPWKLTAVQRA